MPALQERAPAQPLNRDSIKISQQDDPNSSWRTLFTARLHLAEMLPVEKEAIHRHPERLPAEVAHELRERITRKLYGKVREDARKAYLALNQGMRRQYLDYETHQQLQDLFAPLLNAGHELT